MILILNPCGILNAGRFASKDSQGLVTIAAAEPAIDKNFLLSRLIKSILLF
jgi:hypothetical protein